MPTGLMRTCFWDASDFEYLQPLPERAAVAQTVQPGFIFVNNFVTILLMTAKTDPGAHLGRAIRRIALRSHV